MSGFRYGDEPTEGFRRRRRDIEDLPTMLDVPAPAELIFGPDARHEGGMLPAPRVGAEGKPPRRDDLLRALGEDPDEYESLPSPSVEAVMYAERQRMLQLSLRQKVQEEAGLTYEPPPPPTGVSREVWLVLAAATFAAFAAGMAVSVFF